MTAVRAHRPPPTYRWVPFAFTAVVAGCATLGWSVFWLVSG